MARSKNKARKQRSGTEGQRILVLALGAALVLCVASVTIGVMNWMTRAYGDDLTDDLRVEVLNGTGEQGLARTVARALMKKRIDVLNVGNADRSDYPESVLIARKKRPGVKMLGEVLGCRRVVEQIKDDAIVDATLVIGADYRSLNLGLRDNSSLSE